jgi:hypothetical protein
MRRLNLTYSTNTMNKRRKKTNKAVMSNTTEVLKEGAGEKMSRISRK